MTVENNWFLVNNSIRWLYLWTEMCWFVCCAQCAVPSNQAPNETHRWLCVSNSSNSSSNKECIGVKKQKARQDERHQSMNEKVSGHGDEWYIFVYGSFLFVFSVFFLFRVLYGMSWCLHMWLSKADFIQIHNVFWIDDTLGDIIVSWFAANAAFSEPFQRILLIVATSIQRRCI